jgi:hypothetical protein
MDNQGQLQLMRNVALILETEQGKRGVTKIKESWIRGILTQQANMF